MICQFDGSVKQTEVQHCCNVGDPGAEQVQMRGNEITKNPQDWEELLPTYFITGKPISEINWDLFTEIPISIDLQFASRHCAVLT